MREAHNMPEHRLIACSMIAVVLAVMFIMFPGILLHASRTMNRTMVSLDESLMRYRYLLGVLCAVMAYGLFRMALLLGK